MYVGDNPAKDFVNIKPLGVYTIRLLKGTHSSVVAKPRYDAHVSIRDLNELPALLSKHK